MQQHGGCGIQRRQVVKVMAGMVKVMVTVREVAKCLYCSCNHHLHHPRHHLQRLTPLDAAASVLLL